MRSTALVLAALAAAGALGLSADAGSPAATLALALTRTGWVAALALVASLAASLHPRTRRLRRALGLGAAAAATLHAAWALASGWVAQASLLIAEPQLRAGATAWLVLALLALTSWPSVVRGLRLGHWRLLHRAVYAALLLALLHVALSSRAPVWALRALAGATALLLALRALRAAWPARTA